MGYGLSVNSRRALGEFIGLSVTAGTSRAYDKQWAEWTAFVHQETGRTDPLLRGVREDDKPAVVGLFLRQKYLGGARGKQATAVTAGIRKGFTKALLPTDFLDSAVISAARTACRQTAKELRKARDNGPAARVKLPLCESVILGMRKTLWEGRGWGPDDADARMLYLGCVWGYDLDARVSEYTSPEAGAEDHCVRAGDLVFHGMRGDREIRVRGGELGVEGSAGPGQQFDGCMVRTASHKTGSAVMTKLIGRRSPEEAQFLEDLTDWVLRSGVRVTDRLFTRYTHNGGDVPARRELSARKVRDQIKASCALVGLDPAYFSSHSLRKAATTHMSAMGVSEADMRDRGNYSASSAVMGLTYNYSTAGLGPLSSNSLQGGRKPSVRDVRRYLPEEERRPAAGHLG